MTKYEYTKSPVYASILVREIVAAGLPRPLVLETLPETSTITLEFSEELTAGEKITLDGVINAHPGLDEYKKLKAADIDRRTAELIEAGFTFDGKHFSASIVAQKNLLFVQQMLIMKILADVLEQVEVVRDELGLTTTLDLRSGAIRTYMRALQLPYEMSTHEDDLTIEYELPTELSIVQVCATCAQTVLTAYDGGRDLKKDVRDATTHAEVDAVTDSR